MYVQKLNWKKVEREIKINGIDLPDNVYKIYKARSIIKDRSIEEEISDFLVREAKALEESTFKEAIFS